MRKPLSKKTKNISESIAFSILALSRDMKAQNKKVYSLSAGEPDFATPTPIVEKLSEGAKLGYTKYTAVAGLFETRKLVAQKLEKENNIVYSPEEICLTSGTKHALFVSLQALLDEEDEVIIPSPYWVSYSEMVKIAGGKCVIVETAFEDDFKLTPALLEGAITPKTKVLMINNPLNPTGALYSREELLALGNLCVKNGIYILADEIYERIVYDKPFVSVASISEEIKEITLTLNGFSKSHAMTGWRLGYVAASRDIIESIVKIQSHTISHPSSLVQYAGISAYNGECDNYVREMVAAYKDRRDAALTILKTIPNIRFIFPDGAFYFFVDVSHYYTNEITSSSQFASKLIEATGVLVIPGGAFGKEDYIRISYATDKETVVTALTLLKNFLTIREVKE